MRLMELGWNDRKEATKPHIEAEGISTGQMRVGFPQGSSPTWPQDALILTSCRIDAATEFATTSQPLFAFSPASDVCRGCNEKMTSSRMHSANSRHRVQVTSLSSCVPGS